MSDPPQVILLDSNAYLRLARSIRPLLADTFGNAPRYSLFVLRELDEEYSRSARLRNKFEWVNDPEHTADRKAKRYQLSGAWNKKGQTAFSFLAAYASRNGVNISRVDLLALAIGFVRHCPVVADDAGMRRVAKAHQIECWPLLKLLKLMVTEARITLDLVRQIIEYLTEENDLPMGRKQLRAEYKTWFGSGCPV